MSIIWKTITSPAGKFVIVLAAILACIYFIYQEGKKNGAADLAEDINRVDSTVIDKARKSRSDVDNCYAAGRVWSREKGQCT